MRQLPISSYIAGMVLLFFGFRILDGESTQSMAAAGLGLVAVLASLVLRLAAMGKADGAAEKRYHLTQALLVIAALVSIGLWALQAEMGRGVMEQFFSDATTRDRGRGALAVLWPLLWFGATLPMIFMEVSFASMAPARGGVEPWRLGASGRSALVLVLAAGTLGFVNFIGAELEVKRDLSFQQTTRPSEATLKMIEGLAEPVSLYIFYPPANEVAELLRAYAAVLDGASEQLTVQSVDHATDPGLAKKHRVSANGNLVLVRGEKREIMRVGLKIESAKRTLEKLDGEFQKTFLKLTTKSRVAYLTTGHGERDWTQKEEDKKKDRAGLKNLKTVLQRLNYTVKRLGVTEGLAGELPDDATVVFVVGPQQSFLPAEIEALARYAQRGGALFIMLDPEAEELDTAPLLARFGLAMKTHRLAHQRYHARSKFNDFDRYLHVTNGYSSHASVKTLSRYSQQAATVLPGVGTLEKIEAPAEGSESLAPQVTFTVRSMSGTWNDVNGNAKFDKDAGEEKKIWNVAAALSKKLEPDDKGEPREFRAVVVADSDWASDTVVHLAGNVQLLGDGLNWLAGEEDRSGQMDMEKDVRIVHTRDEDVVWFWGTIFAVPALVLGLGLFGIRRRRLTGGAP